MNGRIIFSKKCFNISVGKSFSDNDWYSQKEQKIADKSFVLFLDHSLFAHVWQPSKALELYKSLPI